MQLQQQKSNDKYKLNDIVSINYLVVYIYCITHIKSNNCLIDYLNIYLLFKSVIIYFYNI